MILMIDNYDSFVYNLYQYIGEINPQIRVVRNDQITIEEIEEMQPQKIILSPGPGRPENSKICLEIVKRYYERIPILGVCLGHQVIGMSFGGEVVRAKEPMHGKTSIITHNGKGIFKGIEEEITVTRYHSLIVEEKDLSDEIEVIARTKDDNLIMAIKHKEHDLYGVQFHPESIYTQHGKDIIKNFLLLGVE